MIFTKTPLKDAYIIDIEPFEDERGFFARAWCQNELKAQGLNPRLSQANLSYNKQKGTLRGMHFQRPPHAEVKIVRCIRGALYDVIIDIRPESPTYKQWTGVELSADNRRVLYVPEGFAHGFITLQDDTEAMYLVSEFYTPGAEGGLRWNDPAFNIEWPVEMTVISDKDNSWPDFSE